MPPTKAAIQSVSLIIPTYRRERALINCLECARQQDWPNLEVLVIDQSESHETETSRYLNTISEPVRLIHHTPPSAVGARNRGIHESKGDLLIFIDDDTTFEPNFVQSHVAEIESGNDVVQGRIIEPERGVASRPPRMLPWLRVVGSNTCDQSGVTNTLTGCNFSVTRHAVQKVGLFDPNFYGVVSAEDTDFGMRCVRSGFPIRFSTSAAVVHHRESTGGVDVGMTNTHRAFEPDVLRNDLYFAHKHFHPVIVWQYRLRLAARMRRICAQEGRKISREDLALISSADTAARKLAGRTSI